MGPALGVPAQELTTHEVPMNRLEDPDRPQNEQAIGRHTGSIFDKRDYSSLNTRRRPSSSLTNTAE
jgi:hypothetical protein